MPSCAFSLASASLTRAPAIAGRPREPESDRTVNYPPRLSPLSGSPAEMASVQDALADVASRLASLQAALSDKQQGSAASDATQLVAIQAVAAQLEALVHTRQQQQAPTTQEQQPAPAQQTAPMHAATQQEVGAIGNPAGLPATPFDRRVGPAAGPVTATKLPARTPGGGLPATTPLAAEVLATLNNALAAGPSQPAAAGGRTQPAAEAAKALAVDDADGDAAATLSGMLGGSLQPRTSAAIPAQQQQQSHPTLAGLMGASLPLAAQPMHATAMAAAAAAAAAAGPALPLPRRQSSALPQALLPIPSMAQAQRPCNCKRSMCLKMYCECFAAGGFCAPSCSCLNCSNTPADLGAVHAAREVVLSKNPHAFEVKVTATGGHRRGCRCKRSRCLKKYCECFHAGARCNPDVCQCEDCRNTEGDAMLAPVLARQAAVGGHIPHSWDASADVLAMFQQPMLAMPPAMPLPAEAAGGEGPRGGARALPLPAPAFAFPGLPPMPEPAYAVGAAGGAAGGLLGPLPSAGMGLAPAFMLNPAAAAAAATFAAATTLADQQQQQQMEESLGDAASFPKAAIAAAAPAPAPSAATATAAAPALPVLAATPGAARKVASALTSHLSDMAGAVDPDMHDTATSPAPHMAFAKLAARRGLAPCAAPSAVTLTGGAAGPTGRPPLPSSRVRSRAPSEQEQLSHGSADENGSDSLNTAGSQRSKRPRRAASGGVLGAVAAEASGWALESVSPPLKRANSLPVQAGVEQGTKPGGRPKVSDRVALLKKALVAETTAHAAAAGAEPAALQPALRPALMAGAGCGGEPTTAEDADAISALFELSSSVC